MRRANVVAAAVGGACGGGLVGLGEAVLISVTAAPEEFGLFPFALLAYGSLGLALGPAGWLGCRLLGWACARPALRSPLAFATALVLGPLTFAIARYHVRQRVFGEDLPLFSAVGVAVHVALLVAAVAALVLVYRSVRRIEVRRRAVAVAAVAAVAVFFASVVASSWLVPLNDPKANRSTSRAADPDNASGKPNVILIVIDTLRADAMANARADSAGGIGRLARDGTAFSQAYAQASWTRPSMASLFTSLYPSQHGAVQKADILGDEMTTLAEAFAAAGYWTAGFVTNINLAPIFNFQQGFAEYIYLAPRFYFGASDSATRLAIYKGLRLLREQLLRERIHFENYYQDARVVGDALADWLAGNPPQPFFLFLHFMDPHDPYFEMPYNGRGVARVTNQNPAASRAGELHALYGQGVAYNDAELGRVLDLLEARGLYDGSVIVLTSDHGEEFQEHGGWWHGTTLYQEQLHVPLLFKAANSKVSRAAGGATDDRLVQLIDVAPTLLRSADLAPPAAFAGRDLADSEVDPFVFAEEDHEGNRIVSLRRGDWKIIVANPANPRGLAEVELYDLGSDPSETRNLADDFPERVDAMMLAMTRMRVVQRSRR